MKSAARHCLQCLLIIGTGILIFRFLPFGKPLQETERQTLDENFPLQRQELVLKFSQPDIKPQLAFSQYSGSPDAWKKAARKKLAEVLGFRPPFPAEVTLIRTVEHQRVKIQAMVMKISENLKIPGYLLVPPPDIPRKSAVMAIHGHGSVEPCLGVRDDYHHFFALEMAKAGHLVLCPELRGFGTLNDLAHQVPINRLNYWVGGYSQFTLVTDGFLYGRTLIGETVEDLLRWEEWLSRTHGIEELDVAGISYGGDLCLVYPVFSGRIRRIFASGTMGSFALIFKRCYNAPAHCIPHILKWMDRSDITGLNAPRPIVLHYGELDVPGPDNASASYNESVPRSLKELREIYSAFDAGDAVRLIVTHNKHHEMDIPVLLQFLE